MLEPLERRKLDINREGSGNVSAVATTAGNTAAPGNTSLVSQETGIYSVESVVTGMQKSVAVLIKANNNSIRAISCLTRVVKDYQEPEDSVTSESFLGVILMTTLIFASSPRRLERTATTQPWLVRRAILAIETTASSLGREQYLLCVPCYSDIELCRG